MSEIAVLIPNYNADAWLPRCIESCLKQKYLREIIVVDDHSQDNSWEVLTAYAARYPAIIKVFKNPEKGGNLARNFAFSKSSAPYIQWLDSDDEIIEGKFEQQWNALEASGADIAYSDFRIDFYKDDILQKSEQKAYGPFRDFAEELIKDNWTTPNNYLIKRSFAVKLADGVGWNPATKVGQDREYFTIAAILGARFIYVPGLYAVYNRWNDKSISRQRFEVILQETHRLGILFKKYIRESCLKDRQKYLDIIHTQELKRCYYDSNIQISEIISPLHIRWNLFHYKMRLAIPLVYIFQHFKFFITKKKSK